MYTELVTSERSTVVRSTCAQRHWQAGLYAGHAGGDNAIGANILGFMSCQAKGIGQLRETASIAETARRGYSRTSPNVAAILDLHAAEAYANTGDATRARTAIETAHARLGDQSGSNGAERDVADGD